jgi:hypothetical protein
MASMKFKILFLCGLLLIPLTIWSEEVCNLPQGCPIDENGLCELCVEGENEQELEEEREEEREEREKFWKDVNLKTTVVMETQISHSKVKIKLPLIDRM